jgi:hypothetical protein
MFGCPNTVRCPPVHANTRGFNGLDPCPARCGDSMFGLPRPGGLPQAPSVRHRRWPHAWLSRFLRHGSAGGLLPGATGAPGRRRSARACPHRRTGTQHRRPGRRESRLEARSGAEGLLAADPPRHLPLRATPHLNIGEPGAFAITPWAQRVRRVHARYTGAWELPVFGAVAAPSAVLVRPDGHVAWVGDSTDSGLRDALTHWFGPPTPA